MNCLLISCYVGRYETDGEKNGRKTPSPGSNGAYDYSRAHVSPISGHTALPAALCGRDRYARRRRYRSTGQLTAAPVLRRRPNPFDISCSFVRLSVRRWQRRRRRRPRCRVRNPIAAAVDSRPRRRCNRVPSSAATHHSPSVRVAGNISSIASRVFRVPRNLFPTSSPTRAKKNRLSLPPPPNHDRQPCN